MNNDYKWDDPSGTFRRRTDLVKSYIASRNGLPPDLRSATSKELRTALYDHYQHMWPSFVAKENFTRQQLLDLAIVAHKYFPIANEEEDLEIDRKLIKKFIIDYEKDLNLARKHVNGETMKRIQEIRSGTRYIPKFFLVEERIFISRHSHESSYYRNPDLYLTKRQKKQNDKNDSSFDFFIRNENRDSRNRRSENREISSLTPLLDMIYNDVIDLT